MYVRHCYVLKTGLFSHPETNFVAFVLFCLFFPLCISMLAMVCMPIIKSDPETSNKQNGSNGYFLYAQSLHCVEVSTRASCQQFMLCVERLICIDYTVTTDMSHPFQSGHVCIAVYLSEVSFASAASSICSGDLSPVVRLALPSQLPHVVLFLLQGGIPERRSRDLPGCVGSRRVVGFLIKEPYDCFDRMKL